MAIVKQKEKARAPIAWKPIRLGGELVSKGIEGLIGIEELTDYSLLKKKSPYTKALKVIKVHVPSKAKKVIKVIKDGSQQEKEENPLRYPSSGLDDIDKKIRNEAKKLREKKRKEEEKREQNSLGGNEMVSPQDSEEKDKIRRAKKLERERKRKDKKRELKLKERKKWEPNVQKMCESAEAVPVMPGSSKSSKQIKRTLSKTVSPDEPALKKKKKNDESKPEKTVTTEKKSKAGRKKPKLSKNDKIQAQKLLLENAKAISKNSPGSEILEADSDLEENNSSEGEIASPCTTPIRGMEGWSGLNLPDSILRALAENGFKKPTEIQASSLPASILGRRDIMGAAETGSGKTLAFAIPILYGILQQKKRESAALASGLNKNITEENVEELEPNTDAFVSEPEAETLNSDSDNESEEMFFDDNGIGCVNVIDNADFSFMNDSVDAVVDKPINPKYNQKLYALILTPTRELAMQVKDHIAAAAKYTGIRVTVVIGGLAQQKQERLLKTKPEIVVATPGRLWELIQEGNSFLQQVDDISYLAIDETDRMIERGHFQELQQLLLRINENETKKSRRQNFVFSATLTMVHEPPQRKKIRGKKQQMKVTPGQKLQDVISMLGIKQPKVVDITQESGTARTLEEAQIRCLFDEKDVYLYYFLISNPGRTLIFCNSISCIRRLAQILTILKSKPLTIHANMVQRQRLKNLDRFRANPTGLLLATDVAARGLDIPDVEHVVHYQVPRTSEGYVHRSGRTARASKGGLTLLLIEPAEQQTFTRLCRTLGRPNELPAFDVSQDVLAAAKQRVFLARDIDLLELALKKSEVEHGWYQKALDDMDMVLDKDELPSRISDEDAAGNRKKAIEKRKQLEKLLSRPLFTRK